MDNPAIRETPYFSTQIATAGEALIDLVSRPGNLYEPCLGGAVYNLTRALARQGVGVLYLNPLSADRFGRALAKGLVADGVRLAHLNPSERVTSLAVVGLTESGHPDYAFYREGVADRDVDANALVRACAESPDLRIVCTGGLALAPEDAGNYLPWLEAQRRAGVMVVVDANLRPSVMPDLPAYRRNVQAAMALADIIKVSDEDLVHLSVGGQDAMKQAANLLQSTRALMLLLTLGDKGACLLTRTGELWRAYEAQAVDVVDTVGAGDCFLAGFLAALLGRRPAAGPEGPNRLLAPVDASEARRLLSQALASATLCVMRQGCVPPTAEEVADRIRNSPSVFEPG
jgi:fructokinase